MKYLLCTLLILLAGCLPQEKRAVVLMMGSRSSCSGFKIEAPSGRQYVMTAKHCANMSLNKKVDIVYEGGIIEESFAGTEDSLSDLMLYSSPSDGSTLLIGKSLTSGELLHSLTHPEAGPLLYSQSIFDWYMMIKIKSNVYLDGTSALPGVTHGSSGGPIMNLMGEVVGVVSAVDSHGTTYFVPVSAINRFLVGK